jgi:predicted nucleotidyltransferase
MGKTIPNVGRSNMSNAKISKAKVSKVARKSKSKAKPARKKSLIDALFTATQQKMLRVFFGNPDRKFFATEVINLAGGGSGAIQRELAAFAETGLLRVEQVGKQKYFQANPSSPIFNELRQITLKTVGLAEPLREALRKTGVTIDLALVYGSVAKGTDTASSDIDLLVVSDSLSLEELYEKLEPAESLLSRKISPTLYSVFEFKKKVKAKNPFIQKVLAGDHITLIGDEDAITAVG